MNILIMAAATQNEPSGNSWTYLAGLVIALLILGYLIFTLVKSEDM